MHKPAPTVTDEHTEPSPSPPTERAVMALRRGLLLSTAAVAILELGGIVMERAHGLPWGRIMKGNGIFALGSVLLCTFLWLKWFRRHPEVKR